MQIDPVTFLLIEDDDIDSWAVERALKSMKITNPIIRATDGKEAFEILSRPSSVQKFYGSLIILLDLNLPRMGGFEFLDRLYEMPEFKDVPVIITTTSADNRDLQQAGRFNVTGYVLKSDLVGGLTEGLRDLNTSTQITLRPSAIKETLSAQFTNRQTSVPVSA